MHLFLCCEWAYSTAVGLTLIIHTEYRLLKRALHQIDANLCRNGVLVSPKYSQLGSDQYLLPANTSSPAGCRWTTFCSVSGVDRSTILLQCPGTIVHIFRKTQEVILQSLYIQPCVLLATKKWYNRNNPFTKCTPNHHTSSTILSTR